MTATPLGPQFLVNTTTESAQALTDMVALSDGRVLALYSSLQFVGFQLETQVVGKVFNADGSTAVDEFIVGVMPNLSVKGPMAKGAAGVDGGFVVVWEDGQGDNNTGVLRAQIFNSDAAAIGAPSVVTSTTQPLLAEHGVSAQTGGGFVVSWRAADGLPGPVLPQTEGTIYVRAFDGTGAPQSAAAVVSAEVSGVQDDTDVAVLSTGNMAVAWVDTAGIERGNPFDAIMVRVMSPAGLPVTSSVVAAEPTGVFATNYDAPRITALEGGGFVLVWMRPLAIGVDQSGFSVWARVFDDNAVPQSAEFIVNQTTFDTQGWPSIAALPGGGFVVVYSDYSGYYSLQGNGAILARTFDASGAPSPGEVVVSEFGLGDAFQPFVAATENGFAVAWSDIETGVLDGDSGAVGGRFFTLEDPSNTGSTSPTQGNDVITGTDGDDTLFALGGADEIYGLAGDDVLIGHGGNDLLVGGAHGDDGDTASYENATESVQVYLSAGISRGSDGRDTLIGIENITGSSFDDHLVGDAGDNYLRGGSGNDVLKGLDGENFYSAGEGDDRLIGGAHEDFMAGDAGNDVLISLAGDDYLLGLDGDDFLYGGRDQDRLEGGEGSDKLRGNLGHDRLDGGNGDDDLRGGGNDDTLNGDDGADYLLGENGRDTLYGGVGNDVLTGGRGGGVLDGLRDVFIYRAFGGYDRVKDFEDGIDQLDLTSFAFVDFNAIESLASETASGLRIRFAAGDVVLLEGMSEAEFDVSDVLF